VDPVGPRAVESSETPTAGAAKQKTTKKTAGKGPPVAFQNLLVRVLAW